MADEKTTPMTLIERLRYPAWVTGVDFAPPSLDVERTRKDMEEAAAEIEQAAWRPIETAPKDGAFVLTFTPSRVPQHCVLRWVPGATREQSKWQEGDGRWYVFGPTHWQPLTSP